MNWWFISCYFVKTFFTLKKPDITGCQKQILVLLFICLTIWPSPVSSSNSCFLCFLTSPPDCSSGSNPVYCSWGPLLMFVLVPMSISMSVSVFLYISASMSMSISHISAAQILFTTVDICFWCLFLVSWLLLLTWESESGAESESGNVHRQSQNCSGPNPVYCSQRPIIFS